MPEALRHFFISMSRYHSYWQSASKVIEKYDGKTPLAIHLKQFFAANKQMGSKDRRTVQQLVYQFYRLGKWPEPLSVADRILLAAQCMPAQNEAWLQGVEKVPATAVTEQFTEEQWLNIFPNEPAVSNGITAAALAQSMLRQPHLFVRVRPGFQGKVKAALEKHGIEAVWLSNETVQLPNGAKLDEVLKLNQQAVVQDYSSQRTGHIIAKYWPSKGEKHVLAWDCCAASGGKSIMLYDQLSPVTLTVSDIRDSIITNLKARFAEAGMRNYQVFVADVSAPLAEHLHDKFDVVIADVPCSGSGTWARTPEQLYCFQPGQELQFQQKQKAIAGNVLQAIKPGGLLVYITCSVFAAENEGVIESIAAKPGMQMLHSELINGIEHQADSMFIAVLRKGK
jgi:16S rRNA (cytosine967-C5)-methyltransferase